MKKSIIATVLALVMSLSFLTGCAANTPSSAQSAGGVLLVKVNPAIAVEYDKDGIVTGVTARNDDATAIIAACTDLIGSPANQAVKSLVEAIGRAGYFVEDVDGNKKHITIEIEKGSAVPDKAFLDSVVNDVRDTVKRNNWAVPTEVLGETDYGFTDYADTDYGPKNDGVTDYDDTDYGPENDGITDYDDTDYGPENDGVTDYDNSSNYGNSDYNDSDNDGQSNYDD